MNYLMQIGNRLKNWRVKKYKNWDWNYGKSPKYEYNQVKDYHQVL